MKGRAVLLPAPSSTAAQPNPREAYDAYVARVLADAPPLSTEARAKLAELLRPVRVGTQ